MPKIFRQRPPLELVERILESFGLRSINDKSWFSKPQIRILNLEELLLELEPYYMPCMASQLKEPLTQSRAITLLRQVLKEHGSSIKIVEKSTGGKKELWYSINTPLSNLEQGETCVTFS